MTKLTENQIEALRNVHRACAGGGACRLLPNATGHTYVAADVAMGGPGGRVGMAKRILRSLERRELVWTGTGPYLGETVIGLTLKGLEALGEPVHTCECDTPERRRYIVTGHDGSEALVAYCDGCYELAKCDWNGNTAAVRPA